MGYPHPIHERETPVLSQHFGDPAAISLDGWRKRGGYRALERALSMDPAAVTALIKDSGLRGRGGRASSDVTRWAAAARSTSGSTRAPVRTSAAKRRRS